MMELSEFRALVQAATEGEIPGPRFSLSIEVLGMVRELTNLAQPSRWEDAVRLTARDLIGFPIALATEIGKQLDDGRRPDDTAVYVLYELHNLLERICRPLPMLGCVITFWNCPDCIRQEEMREAEIKAEQCSADDEPELTKAYLCFRCPKAPDALAHQQWREERPEREDRAEREAQTVSVGELPF